MAKIEINIVLINTNLELLLR